MKNMSRKSIGIALLACVGVLGAEELSEGAKQYRDHRFAEAEKSLQQQVNEHSEDAEAQALLGRDLIALKKIDEGEAAIRKAQEMGLPEDEVLVGMATAAIERRDVGKAMELLNKAVEINPESADALHYRGLVMAQQKDFQGAIADLEKIRGARSGMGLYALLSGCRLQRGEAARQDGRTLRDVPEALAAIARCG
ncbi:MAG: tetratricopeptide repeat protein [Bryobacterales bacterium]